jgi:DNA invertase Pin-like site-specific DNA recombinase
MRSRLGEVGSSIHARHDEEKDRPLGSSLYDRVAEFEREMLRERVKAGMAQAPRTGKP